MNLKEIQFAYRNLQMAFKTNLGQYAVVLPAAHVVHGDGNATLAMNIQVDKRVFSKLVQEFRGGNQVDREDGPHLRIETRMFGLIDIVAASYPTMMKNEVLVMTPEAISLKIDRAGNK
ncbi:hypothetical protein CF95_gp183 [Erwinia phage PhiEaH1]|uniref:Uncharacterized protein n=1 Tax=Erwinia phage PhiEaH1 TaxID=1401669 RepID=W8CZZ7_9CAUD|nr:hypothetical protein CF95_gp183 [Erwinia phage PhiEaH1]AGX01905.1 hypothetical protein [Erwinia phage PhiEaH1]WBF04905.1 hypothetical protein [Erwinia phage vB_Ea277G]